jgi:uncharacterized protein
MRLPFLSLFVASPFEGLQEHAEKVKDCSLVFQQAIECYVSRQCHRFEELRKSVQKLEHEADAIKRRIRGHLPKGTLMPVDKFQFFRYLSEQDKVIDAAEDALDWISYRPESGFPFSIEKELFLLVDAVLDPVEELSRVVAEARKYFQSFSQDQRQIVKGLIRALREQEQSADDLEDALKRKAFHLDLDPLTVFHIVRLAEIIGSIADHAENAGDMMRAMVAR